MSAGKLTVCEMCATCSSSAVQRPGATEPVVLPFTVTTTLEPDGSTLFVLAAADTDYCPAGSYVWDMQQVGSTALFRGRAPVIPQISE